MIRAHHRNAAEYKPLSAQPRNRLLLAINRLKSNRAEAHDGFGIDDRKLPVQKWRAGFHFVRLRRAIFRRTAFHHVADVNVFALEAHRFDHLREQFSGAPHERQSLNIFVAPRPFADEHQFRARIAAAEDNGIALLTKLASLAIPDILADYLQRIVCDALARFEERSRFDCREGCYGLRFRLRHKWIWRDAAEFSSCGSRGCGRIFR